MSDRTTTARGVEPTRAGPPEAPQFKHCWVTDHHGRLPGLLLEWRQLDGCWRGRVVRATNEAGAWVIVEEWLPADLLEPVDDDRK